MALVPPKSSVCPPVAACSMGVGKGAGPPWCPCTWCLWRCPHAGSRVGCGSGCPREAKKRGKETTWGGKELGLAALRPSGCAPHTPVWDLPRLGSSTGWDRPSLSQGPALPAPLQVPPQALCDPISGTPQVPSWVTGSLPLVFAAAVVSGTTIKGLVCAQSPSCGTAWGTKHPRAALGASTPGCPPSGCRGWEGAERGMLGSAHLEGAMLGSAHLHSRGWVCVGTGRLPPDSGKFVWTDGAGGTS